MKNGSFLGLGALFDSEEGKKYVEDWVQTGGDKADLAEDLRSLITSDEAIGYIPGARAIHDRAWDYDFTGLGDDTKTQATFERLGMAGFPSISDDVKRLVNNAGSDVPVYYKGNIYWYRSSDETYCRMQGTDVDTGGGAKNTLEAYLKKLQAYKTGGLADFTGPAWLDGTPSKPEYILNSAQTERFFSLVDILERFDSDAKSQKPSGDNYFDIEINVEKLENDYDVEQVAEKIRRMIYDDATYRNVNAVNHIR